MIPVQNSDVLGALRGFLKSFLETGTVDALYVPLETENGAMVPALVTDPARLDRANPLAPVMPINGARAVSALTGKHSPARRGCAPALVRDTRPGRAGQAAAGLFGGRDPDQHGLPRDVRAGGIRGATKQGDFHLPGYLAAAQAGQEPASDGLALRPACQMCVQPFPAHARSRCTSLALT